MRTSSMWMSLYMSVIIVAIGISLWPPVATTTSCGMMDDRIVLTNPFERLIKQFPLLHSTNDPELQDLRVINVSVQRIRYEESTSDHENERETASLFQSIVDRTCLLKRSTRMSSVVVTWEDHMLAQQTREAYCFDQRNCPEQKISSSSHRMRDVAFEVQVWVNGWGLDALWHPANRKVRTNDPLVMFQDLPRDQELSIRVRMKVKTRTGVLAGWFASEVDGPWSDIVVLSPTTEHRMELVFSFLSSNKAFGLVLGLTIGISLLVILNLVLRSSLPLRSNHQRSLSPTKSVHRKMSREEQAEEETTMSLEQELSDVRQELADSEAEVRRLMLFRGYGIDGLTTNELFELEMEMRRVLQQLQTQRRLRQGDGRKTDHEEDVK